MGDILIGALLGAENRALSFDSASRALSQNCIGIMGVGSWSSLTTVGSRAFVTDAHSSRQALDITANSQDDSTSRFGFGSFEHRVIQYTFNDMTSKMGPEITGHTLRALAWARAMNSQSDGKVAMSMQGNSSDTYVHSSTAAVFQGSYGRLEAILTDVRSVNDTPPRVNFSWWTAASAYNIRADDVLAVVDEQTIHPTWEFEDKEQVIKSEFTTQGGYSGVTRWGGYKSFLVPMDMVTASLANLINHWWRIQSPCLFTLDSSDSNASWPVRIVNAQLPFGKRQMPYLNRYSGYLELQSINGGELSF